MNTVWLWHARDNTADDLLRFYRAGDWCCSDSGNAHQAQEMNNGATSLAKRMTGSAKTGTIVLSGLCAPFVRESHVSYS